MEYRFISLWLQGKFSSELEMVQRLKYAIHDFTRRQLTWFRRDKRIMWIDGIEEDRGSEVMLRSAENATQAFLNEL